MAESPTGHHPFRKSLAAESGDLFDWTQTFDWSQTLRRKLIQHTIASDTIQMSILETILYSVLHSFQEPVRVCVGV